jgi:hypothetical protein
VTATTAGVAEPLIAFLDTIRNHHLAMLIALPKYLRAQGAPAVATEVLVETDAPNVFASSMRFDAVFEGPQFRDVEPELADDLPYGFGFERDGARRAFGPFSWGNCPVQARLAGNRWDPELRTWTVRWLDLADERPCDAQGLCGVIHGVRDVDHDGDVLRFSVDFGSAGIESVLELMDALVDAGASVVVFGGSARLAR